MPGCTVLVCKYTSSKVNYSKDGISFHTYPKDPKIKEKWIKAVGRGPDWFPTKNSTICSSHFEPKCFQPLQKVRRLFEWSVPTIKLRAVLTNYTEPSTSNADINTDVNMDNTKNPDVLIDSGPSCPKIIKTESLDAPTTSSTGGEATLKVENESDSDEDPLQIPRCASPSGLSDIGSSDLEGAFDTPTVLYLKKKLRENEEKLREKDEEFKKTLKAKDEKIESLQKVNKRLNEKIITLKQLLVKMKRKILNIKRNENDDSDNKDLEPSQDT